MALSSSQLADLVAKAKLILRIEDDDAQYHSDAIALFCTDANTSAATVQVTDTTVVLVIVDGAGAATTTLTLADAANDTLGELATVIDGTAGWTANLLGKSDADSGDLVRLAATGCLTQANEVVLATENLELLELLITNTFDALEDYLGRQLLSTSYSELIYPERGIEDIILTEPDVTSVDFIAMETQSGIRAKYTGAYTNVTIEVTDTAVVTRQRTATGTTLETESTFAANTTISSMAIAINTIAGWTASSVNDGPSSYLVQQGGRVAKDVEQTLETWTDWDCEYESDYKAGVIRLPARTWPLRETIRIDYTAGLAAIPASVEQVILSLVKGAWDTTKRSSGLKSERLGDYAYAIADGGGSDGSGGGGSDFGAHDAVLSRYMRVRI